MPHETSTAATTPSDRPTVEAESRLRTEPMCVRDRMIVV
jgi:hypothetical protein